MSTAAARLPANARALTEISPKLNLWLWGALLLSRRYDWKVWLVVILWTPHHKPFLSGPRGSAIVGLRVKRGPYYGRTNCRGRVFKWCRRGDVFPDRSLCDLRLRPESCQRWRSRADFLSCRHSVRLSCLLRRRGAFHQL
jgi:hypothetical protein